MGTQRLEFPCSFRRKEEAKSSFSLQRPAERRGSCFFRPTPVTIAQTASWEGKQDIRIQKLNRKRSLQKFYESVDEPRKKRSYRGGKRDAKDEENSSFFDIHPKSGSNSSSDTHEDSSEGVSLFESKANVRRAEHEGLELLNLLIQCTQAISSSKHTAANLYLSRLGDLSCPNGTPIHRLVAYFTEALALRAVNKWQHIFSIAPPRELTEANQNGEATALRILNNVTAILRFIHFTLNERMLAAFGGKERIHIIDFDIRQGLQWPSLLHCLASMSNPPIHVRITGIGESKQELQDTGARLAGLAQELRLPFEFHSVVDRVEDIRLWMLHVKEKECVAVNCVLQLHRALYDENGIVLMGILGLIRSANPSIVLLAETEADHNEQRWEMRLANALKYYSAVFDLLDHSFTGDSPLRLKLEEMFARKIRNVVAEEGAERVERHQRFDRWRGMMQEVGGFCSVGFSEREIAQSKMLLKMYTCENYCVEKEGEGDGFGLTLKWMGQSLYTVSAWTPMKSELQSGYSLQH